MARVTIEMGGGRSGEVADGFREASAPDWVKLALMEMNGGSVRRIYDDGSFTEWRLKVTK
jgi:hypothetical protein